MPNNNLLLGAALGAVAVMVIGALVYFITTSGSFAKPDTMALARNTCEVTIGSTPKYPTSLTPAEGCDCIFTQILPRLDEDARKYLLDVYTRAETGAPDTIAQRTRYDSDFIQRFSAVFNADRLSNPTASLKLGAQLQGMQHMDLGPKCNALNR